MGRDNSWLFRIDKDLVSTHAPAWGATNLKITSPLLRSSFNPRARMGRDLVNRRIQPT